MFPSFPAASAATIEAAWKPSSMPRGRPVQELPEVDGSTNGKPETAIPPKKGWTKQQSFHKNGCFWIIYVVIDSEKNLMI